jgi:hypothetical protein
MVLPIYIYTEVSAAFKPFAFLFAVPKSMV